MIYLWLNTLVVFFRILQALLYMILCMLEICTDFILLFVRSFPLRKHLYKTRLNFYGFQDYSLYYLNVNENNIQSNTMMPGGVTCTDHKYIFKFNVVNMLKASCPWTSLKVYFVRRITSDLMLYVNIIKSFVGHLFECCFSPHFAKLQIQNFNPYLLEVMYVCMLLQVSLFSCHGKQESIFLEEN